jgi:hypothetical protein
MARNCTATIGRVVVLKKSADATPLKSLGFAIYSIE